MSRPYQFTEESSKSPLDPKPHNVFQAGQPPSFKTNVNRMKTKRWVEAKSFSYDGDDWGEYDEYDEYGANGQPPPPPKPTAPTGPRQQEQSAGEPGHSFTDPQAAGQPPIPRKNSFDAGDERRVFSTATPPPLGTLNQKTQIDTAQIHTKNGTVGESSGMSPVTALSGQSIHQYSASNGQRPAVAVQIPAVVRQTSAAQSDTSDTPQHRRDFSPSALPPPLQTRMSPAPSIATVSPAGARFPTRKSSLSQSSPTEPAGSPFTQSAPSNMPSAPSREHTPSNAAKPPPFIRPADVYKRVNEEREKERQSMESNRPSLDSLMSRPGEDAAPSKGPKERTSSESLGRLNGRRPSLERPGDGHETGRTLQPMLEPVAERKSEYLPDFSLPGQGVQSTATQPAQSSQPSSTSIQPNPLDRVSQTPALPQVHRLSTFGDDFWSSATASGAASSPATGNEVSNQPPYGDPGFRSVVDQAFNRTDDCSAPPTPMSKQSESGISRSNTDSTSGISPIMSRVPSSATSALKARNAEARETSTPAIAEETSDTGTPPSRPPSAAMLGSGYQIPRKPSPGHSRNVSGGSIPGSASATSRSGLNTPSPAHSPARSPAIEPRKPLPEPEVAVISSLSPTSPNPIEGGLAAPSTNYATREADIASAMRQSPEKDISGLGDVEKESQVAFLESHKDIKALTLERPPQSRSGSPSKGRVQELAGKFNEISESRRNSTHSIASKDSVSSWERSQEDLTLPAAGAQGLTSQGRNNIPDIGAVRETLAERPVAHRGGSFRPKLPGQWESYTTAATPSEKGDSNLQLGHGDARIAEQRALGAPIGARGEADEEIDLTPTTAKHSAVSDSLKPASDPPAALQAAGNTMGEAIKASVGMGKGPSDVEMERDTESRVPTETHGYSVDDVYLRPLQLERTASSIASSVPPTPPPKDNSFKNATPESEDMPPPVPLKQKSPEPSSPKNDELTPTRPAMLPQLSTDPSLHDQESDKLRKEIVLSLSPLKTSEAVAPEPSRSSLQPNGLLVNNRDSSILPAEYESYWANGDVTNQPTEPQPSRSSNEVTGRALETIPDVSSAQIPASTGATMSPPTSYGARPDLLDQRSSLESDPTRFSPQSSLNTQATPDARLSQTAKEKPKASSPTLRLVEKEAVNKLYITPTTSFGPGHTGYTVQPIPSVVEPEPSAQRSRTPPMVAETSTGTSQFQNTRELTPPGKLSIEGLHVVNSENPEAVDIPPRLSAEVVPKPPPAQPQSPSHEAMLMGPRPQATQVRSSQPNSIMDRPPGFREILAIKSSPDRIATYNMAREHFARPNTGLSTWLAATVAANPDSKPLANLAIRPTMSAAGPSRHKPTGSISLFAKLSTHNSQQQPQATPYFEQYNAAASQMPTHVGPSTPTAAPQGNQQSVSGAGAGGKSTSHQMQAKGKDLLHSAGVLGGKATIGAKGLFAKGKGRFRVSGGADKAARTSSISSTTASREASEEPEWVTTPEKHVRGTTSSDPGDSKDKKEKKRRLSSPFSRSKPRPSSVVLPKSQQLDFTTLSMHSRGTPPRETPPTEGSRPHSYAAPDSWNIQDPDQQTLHLTPPRALTSPPDRLGILPSPAKSAFSLVQQEKDGDIPLVPPIPKGMEEWQKEKGKGEESQAHRNLQSVIKHSTPPVLETFQRQNPGDLEISQKPVSVDTKDPVSEEPLENPPTTAGDLSQPTTAAPQSVNLPAPGPGDVSPILLPQEENDDEPPQLNHEPLLTTALPQHLRQPLDISPASVPLASESGDISPVASSEDHHRLSFNDDQEDTPARQETDFTTTKPQHQAGDPEDVSPVLSSLVTRGFAGKENHNSTKSGDREDPQTSKDRPAYETELIGAGDVSPVSSEGHRMPVFEGEDEKATPTKHTNSSASKHTQNTIASAQNHISRYTPAPPVMQKENPVSQQQQTESEVPRPSVDAPGAFPETPAKTPDELYSHTDTKPTFVAPPVPKQLPPPPPSQTLRVMQAVEYAPTRSSMESWEQESISELPPQPDDGPFADRYEVIAAASNAGHERQLQEFSAHVQSQEPQQQPRMQPSPLQVAQQEEQLKQEPVPTPESAPEQAPKHTQSHEQAPVHGASRNLLSLLSSAVSAEGTPTSTTSNRSIWSRASNHQAPATTSAPRYAAQAPMQSADVTRESQPEILSPVHDDGFDLYADHNGIVRDLHDEKTGEPVRVAPIPVSVVPASVPTVAEPPVRQPPMPLEVVVTPRERVEQSPVERPMSFISLPRDARGRPQEQINREDIVEEEASRDITPQPQADAPVAEPAVISIQQSRGEGQPQRVAPRPEEHKQTPLEEEQARRIAAAAAARQPERGMGPSPGAPQQQIIPPQAGEQVRQQAGPAQSMGPIGPLSQQAGQPLRGLQEQHRHPPQQVGPGQPLSPEQYIQDPRMQDPRMQDPRMINPHMQDPRAQDPRMQDPRMQDPRLQDPRLQDPRLQDPRLQDPRLQDPRLQDPRLQDPRLQDPRMQDPRVQDPRVQDPRVQDPRVQDPRVQDPRVQDPRVQDPRVQDPRVQDPRMQDPRMQDPRIQDPRMQDPRMQDPRMQDPRMQGRITGQPYPQDPRVQAQVHIPGQPYSVDPRLQGRLPGQPYSQDPRMQGQQYGSPPLPRNEYEAQQQMMARQAMDPRLLGAEYQLSGVGPPQAPAQQEVPDAGRLKVASSVSKGRAHPNLVQLPSNNRINPQLTSPNDSHRSFSYQPSLGDLPEQQINDKKKQRKPSIFSSLASRPQSVGTESHISQESTVAHAADSRLDLRYPTSPASFKGIPPQVPPPGAPMNSSKNGKNAQPQPQRASTTGVPETGKKKRFSGLGSFFGRTGTTGHSPSTKPSKLSKKGEKAAKAQKPPVQQYQQPQIPQQQYPQQRPVILQVSQGYPIPPQYPPPQGVPQQYYPPPGPQRNPSAHVETRTVVQPPTQPPQGQPSVSPPTRQLSPQDAQLAPLSTTTSFEHTVSRIDEAGEEPPAGGYYAPQRWSHNHGASGFAAIAQQATAGQQPPNQRRLSSTSSLQSSQNPVTTPTSQRVSSPNTEPRYEIPQVPAAYSNGVSKQPPASQPAPQPANLPNQVATAARGQSPSSYGVPARQYSDPHRPNISPQVLGQSQMTPGSQRASASSPVVSPISNPSPSTPQQPPQQQYQRGKQPRMGSISEASHQERPWNISLPIEEGGEDEVAYIERQQQMQIQQQVAAQEQAVRNGHTPSPHPPQSQQAPPSTSSPTLQGFREVLPRSSPQPYLMRQPPQSPQPQQPQKQPPPNPSPHPSQHLQPPPHSNTQTPQPQQPAPVHPYQLQTNTGGPIQAAAYPLPTSPATATSPINPLATALPPPPPPKIPHSPPGMHPDNPAYGPQPPQQPQAPAYQEQAYGPQPPHVGYNESRRDSLPVPLSHPQPASMAAQPQRSASDMGANMLRQRLLEAEERERIERMQRADEERIESERERAERERARVRARELERGRGSTASRSSAWERNRGAPAQAFELSAEEDEEPVMRGVSYPGMEWTPMWDGD